MTPQQWKNMTAEQRRDYTMATVRLKPKALDEALHEQRNEKRVAVGAIKLRKRVEKEND